MAQVVVVVARVLTLGHQPFIPQVLVVCMALVLVEADQPQQHLLLALRA
jgi:hypothetical protein